MTWCSNSSWKLIGTTAQQIQSRYLFLHKALGSNWVWSRTGSFSDHRWCPYQGKTLGKTEPQQRSSVAFPCFSLMVIQEHSGDSGQYQGSFPGRLWIEAGNFQGQIQWKKNSKKPKPQHLQCQLLIYHPHASFAGHFVQIQALKSWWKPATHHATWSKLNEGILRDL